MECLLHIILYRTIKNIMRNSIKLIKLMIIEKKNSYMKAVANIVGVGAAMTLANPVELVRIRMQTMSELV